MFEKIKQVLYTHSKYGKSRYLNYLYRYDMQRYLSYSGMNEGNPENVAGQMRLLIHTIEKGMSLSYVKPGFGKEKIEKLIELYQLYEKNEGRKDEQVLRLAQSTVRCYAEYQSAAGVDISYIPQAVLQICSDEPIVTGAMAIEKAEPADFVSVAMNRHSVRSFSTEKIEPERIYQAIQLAQTAPSACNRQATCIYVCLNEEKIRTIMEIHGGLNGFDVPTAIFVVTGNLALYQNEYERNAVFVDGGIFLMNMLYALEQYKIAACPIIWGAEPDRDRILYELLKIPKSQEIISLVAAGNFPNGEVKVACSMKRPTETVLHMIE